jgi:hypothetical protein
MKRFGLRRRGHERGLLHFVLLAIIPSPPALFPRGCTSQLNRATYLRLLLNVIAVWNTRYMQAALDHLRTMGYPVLERDLEHLSPILSGHINLHGSHHFDLQAPKKRRGQMKVDMLPLLLRLFDQLLRVMTRSCTLLAVHVKP